MSPLRRVMVGALVTGGALVLLSGLAGGRGILRELVLLLALATAVLLAGRAGWRWWRGQPAAIASIGIFGGFAIAGGGWLLVALVHALGRVSSENYGMLIVWPAVFLVGIAVICAGVLGTAVGVAVVVSALTRPAAHRALIVIGGAASVVLNLLHVRALTRLLLTG